MLFAITFVLFQELRVVPAANKHPLTSPVQECDRNRRRTERRS